MLKETVQGHVEVLEMGQDCNRSVNVRHWIKFVYTSRWYTLPNFQHGSRRINSNLACLSQINDTFTVMADGNTHVNLNRRPRSTRSTSDVTCAATFKFIMTAGGWLNGAERYTYALNIIGQDVTRARWHQKHDLPGKRLWGSAINFQNQVYYFGGDTSRSDVNIHQMLLL